jgi:MFS family permease
MSFDEQIEQDLQHNFIFNVLDGAFFWFGSGFFASRTILPLYVTRFSDSELLLGLLSTITTTGWLLPQLFTVNWVERLPRKKVVPVRIGLFTERLPILMMAISTLFAVQAPVFALAAFFVCFAWHTVGAGVVAVAWQDMLAKVIPTERRGRFFGLTNFIGMGAGMLGAAVARWFLGRFTFPTGYSYAFFAGASLIFLSWIFLAQTREPAREPDDPDGTGKIWRRIPNILRSNANFRRYLLTQIVLAFGGMASGFLAVYVTQRWNLPDSRAGDFTIALLLGQSLSALAFGGLSDRSGHKLILELAALAGGLAVGLAALAPAPIWFYLAFFLSGVKFGGFFQSGVMIALEFTTPDLRPAIIGINNTVSGIAAGIAPLIGGWIARETGYQTLFIVAFAIGMVGLAMLRWFVKEPRTVANGE